MMRRIKAMGGEAGQSLVELALTLPMLLLLVLGTVDLGLGFKTYIALTNAAREGVRWISIHPDDPAGALARVNAETERIGLLYGDIGSDSDYTVNFSPLKDAYSAGEEVTVTIQYDYELLFGAITGLPSIPFSAHATMMVLYDPPAP
ncbi:MAG TPA: TadE/TadG family type IV pilus assembly protein [Caldilineaceae bacterium]|nr:TadE/TadG family type IV pilus assembly protein [Caldilineaceae bacterium]